MPYTNICKIGHDRLNRNRQFHFPLKLAISLIQILGIEMLMPR